MDGQCNGPSTANKISPENDALQQLPLTQQGNLFTSSEVKKDLPVKQLDKMSMMDQLAQELGKKQKLYQLKQLVRSFCIVSTIFIVWEFQSTKSWDKAHSSEFLMIRSFSLYAGRYVELLSLFSLINTWEGIDVDAINLDLLVYCGFLELKLKQQKQNGLYLNKLTWC